MSDVVPALRETGLAGRPPKHARAFLERQRPVLVARWVRSCRRALKYLNDPNVPIDANWIRLFNSLADRIGHPRVTTQMVESTSASVTFEARAEVSGARFTDGEALAFVERRIESLRLAARASSEAVEELAT